MLDLFQLPHRAKHMSRSRKRSYDPVALRDRVLDVASAIFQVRGYHSASTHEIIRDAGITGGALHHHFPTKKSLGLAVIEERVARAVEQTWMAPMRQAPTVLEGVLEVFERVADELEERGQVLGCPLNNLAIELSSADNDFQVAVSRVFDSWRKTIVDKARAQHGAGEADANELGTLIVAAYSGAIAMAKAQQDAEPVRACARQLATLLGERGLSVNQKDGVAQTKQRAGGARKRTRAR